MRYPRLQRPERYRLRADHDLCDRLAVYVPSFCHWRYGSEARMNLCPRVRFNTTLLGSGLPNREIGPLGEAIDYTGGQAHQTTGWANSIGTGDFTIACHMRDTSSTGSFVTIAGFGSFSPSLYERYSTKWGMYSGAGYEANTTLTGNLWWTLVATRRSGTLYFYLNGRPDGAVAAAFSFGTGNLQVGYEGFSYGSIGMTWMGFWERSLSEREAISLHDDPWQMLEPVRRRRMVLAPAAPVGGAVGGVLWSGIFRPGARVAA